MTLLHQPQAVCCRHLSLVKDIKIFLTNVVYQPIHIIRLDERTGNIFILAGRQETIEFEIDLTGVIIP